MCSCCVALPAKPISFLAAIILWSTREWKERAYPTLFRGAHDGAAKSVHVAANLITQMKEEGTVSVLRRTGGNVNCSWQVVLTSWRAFGGFLGCVSAPWLINHRALTQLKRGKWLRFSRNTGINGRALPNWFLIFADFKRQRQEF